MVIILLQRVDVNNIEAWEAIIWNYKVGIKFVWLFLILVVDKVLKRLPDILNNGLPMSDNKIESV